MWSPVLSVELAEDTVVPGLPAGTVLYVVGFAWTPRGLEAVYVREDGAIDHVPVEYVVATRRVVPRVEARA